MKKYRLFYTQLYTYGNCRIVPMCRYKYFRSQKRAKKFIARKKNIEKYSLDVLMKVYEELDEFKMRGQKFISKKDGTCWECFWWNGFTALMGRCEFNVKRENWETQYMKVEKIDLLFFKEEE